MSYGLMEYSQRMRDEGLKGKGDIVKMEADREQMNDRIKSQKKQSQMGGAASGAMMGAQVAGPWGAVVGAVAGFALGGL